MKRGNLRFKINLAIFSTCLAVAVVFGTILIPFEMSRRESQLEKIKLLLISIADQNREDLANQIFGGHLSAMAETLKAMKVKGVEDVRVYSAGGALMLSAGPEGRDRPAFDREELGPDAPFAFVMEIRNGAPALTFVAQIRIDIINAAVGFLEMRYSLADLERESNLTLLIFFCLLFSMILLMAVLLNILLTRSVIQPVSLLRDAIKQIRAGRLGERLGVTDTEEIGEVVAAFNEMSDQLQKNQARLDEYSRNLEAKVSARTHAAETRNEALRKEIGRRKRIQAELVQAKEAAEDASRTKSNFLASMSHEIRTPMNAIIGMTDLIRKTALSDKQAEYLDAIQNASRTLLGLLNDILDLSKIEAGKLDMDVRDFRPSELVSDVLDMFRAKAGEKGVGLDLSVDPGVPEVLRGDDLRLRQVLVNLIGNGIKFTEKGGVSVHVNCPEKNDDRAVLRCEVRDTGVGVSADQAPRLFDAFTQADNSSVRKYEGAGLGLAICKRLVRMLGGDIGVESVPGAGSRFYFTAAFGRGVAGAEPEEAGGGLIVSRPPAGAGLKGVRALLVEDNRINQQVAAEILKDAGIYADIAENGKEALDALSTSSYDAVLMDVQMPEMDGHETTRRIRSSGADYQDIPVIAMTAAAMKGDREMCLAAGMNDVVTKPVDTAELISALERWVPERPADADLPVIDADEAVERLRGNRKLFLSLLRDFKQDYGAAVHELAEKIHPDMFQESDFAETLQTIHTIKGVAGNLSARPLLAAARALEAAVKEKTADKIPELKAAFLTAFSDAIAAIEALEQGDAETAPPDEGGAPARPDAAAQAEPDAPEDIEALLTALAELLRKNNPKAEETLETLKARLAHDPALGPDLDELERQIGRFNFKDAGRTLARIAGGIHLNS